MMLFDGIDRDELRSDTPFVSLFQDINHYDWPGADNIRNRLELWFNQYPDAHKQDLCERFRSDEDYNHEGALFELFLHELLTRLGFSLRIHPEIPDTANRPDFLACQDGQRFYLEATVVGQKSGPFTRNRNEQDVVEKLNTLRSPNFCITIHMEGKLIQTLSKETVVRPFEKLLLDHNPDEVLRLIDERGINATPSQRIEYGDWSLEGWLNPIAPEKRNSGLKRPFVLGNHRGKFTDCLTPVRKALREKVGKYRNLDVPFVVALHTRDPFYNGQAHDMEMLFGQEQLLYSKDQPDLPPKFDRKQNGVWPHKCRLDAFWRFQRVDLWNLWHNASGCLYINPHKPDVTLPDVLFRLPHAKGCDGKMEWMEGEGLTKILGI